MLLLRLVIGLYLTWRLVRAATPVNAPWAADADVRVSRLARRAGHLRVDHCAAARLRRLGCERSARPCSPTKGAHVANRDFYLLLLAALNRAVFWFSPFALVAVGPGWRNWLK